MKTEEEINAKLNLYRTYLQTFDNYKLAININERVKYLQNVGAIGILEWVLEESEE